jgi:hypothetical protein
MRRTATRNRELPSLIQELLDAHADTVELATERTSTLVWEAHLDYLRALQRRAKEMLARGGGRLDRR